MEDFKLLLKRELSDVNRIGIAYAKEWFKGTKYGYPVRDDDYVVCRWSDYHDGQSSHIEGKTTIAICREFEDAHLIFKSRQI